MVNMRVLGFPAGFAVVLGSLSAVGACTQDDSTPLSEISTTYGSTTMEIVAGEQINILVHVDGDGCPKLSDDVIAKFDGELMEVSRGGPATNASGCYPIAFWFNKFPADRIASTERTASATGGGAEMIVQDATATWRVSPTQLFGNQLVIDAAASRLVWQNVDRITDARVEPTANLSIQGDSIYYPAGTKISFAQAHAHPQPTLCTGPSLCTVDLAQTRSYDPNGNPVTQ